MDGRWVWAHNDHMPATTRPARNASFTSPATGIIYWIDEKGLATEEAQYDEVFGCECEQDWNCPLHGGTTRPTWIETRYWDGDDR